MMPPWYSGRMPADEVTLAKVLQQNGYTTGHCGKWHMAINHHAFPQPEDQGFDWTRSNRGATGGGRPNRLTGFATRAENDPFRLDENGFAKHQNSEDAWEQEAARRINYILAGRPVNVSADETLHEARSRLMDRR